MIHKLLRRVLNEGLEKRLERTFLKGSCEITPRECIVIVSIAGGEKEEYRTQQGITTLRYDRVCKDGPTLIRFTDTVED